MNEQVNELPLIEVEYLDLADLDIDYIEFFELFNIQNIYLTEQGA